MNRRLLGPLLSVILILGVGAAIYVSARDQFALRSTATVKGLIGSEKEEFFLHPEVIAALRRNGIVVEFEKAGSRQISTSYDLSQYDFAFPAGVPAAEKIRREQKITKSYEPFFTPMAIATWKPIALTLVANGLAKDEGGYYTLDMEKLLAEIVAGKRWKDLKDNPAYAINKRILISSTDVRKSNSAAMYMALASYVLNGNQMVGDAATAAKIQAQVEELFLQQGFTEYSSEGPFEDYLMMGMGKAPLVMVYEAQFITRTAAADGSITDEMVLMYPKPTIFTKHILVPLTENGSKLGELLENDPELQKLAVDHGFRSSDVAYFREYVQTHNLSVPQSLVDVIDSPSYEVLEGMIQIIEQKYQ